MKNKAQGAGSAKTDLTTCEPGWSGRRSSKCLQRHSGVLPDSELTEYAYALAKADRFQEALDVLDSLDDPITPRALNYRGYATRKLGVPTTGSATTSSPSRSIRPIRRCVNISAKLT